MCVKKRKFFLFYIFGIVSKELFKAHIFMRTFMLRTLCSKLYTGSKCGTYMLNMFVLKAYGRISNIKILCWCTNK